jgi:hypothetical protein
MFVRIVNALLGLWLFASAFLFDKVPTQFYNELLVSIGVMVFGLASILGRHRARRVNFALGLWLFVSALLLPHVSGAPMVNQILTAVLLVITSLFPSRLHYQGARTAT